jgi:cytochrome P450
MESMDFFRDDTLVADPYPYFEAMRIRCPVAREPHHDVVMVTGYDEAVAVLGDATNFSSCMSVTGPFPGFPVPLEGDDVSDLIAQHRDEIPMSDQIITLDPPTHTDHRALLMGLITPKRLKENEAFMWELADRGPRRFPHRRPGRVHRRVRRPVQPACHRRPARRARRRP